MTQTPTFCPICSTRLIQREEGGRLRPACDNCGYVHYVNPVPGVGIVIEMDGGVVLIQRGNPPHQSEWTLPSGFVEADESAEETAVREAQEETGLQVEIIELMAINSFPEGPPVSGIMIFYRAKPIGGTLQAGDDAIGARVFQPDEMPLLPFRTHRETMALWMEKFVDAGDKSPTRTKPQILIRPYTPADADQVVGLLATIPANRHLSESEWQQVIWRMQEASQVEVFVAELNENIPMIIGCSSLSIVRGLTDSVGLIGNMAVSPAYQRRGVGADLLSAMMRRASQLHLRSLWVNSLRANDQARAFYAALGFEQLDLLRLRLR